MWSVLGDGGPRWHVVFSDDRKQLAALAPPEEGAGQDELRLIDLTTGQERRTMIEHRRAWDMSFAPGGELLLFEDRGELLGDHQRNDARLYAVASLRLLGKVLRRDHWPHWRWSADGKALLTCTTDQRGTTLVRRLAADGDTIIPIKGAGEWLDITPDGKTVLTAPTRTGGKDGAPINTIILWDLPAGTQRGAIAVDAFSAAASSDNLVVTEDCRTLLITMGEPRDARVLGVWDLETGQWLAKVPLDAHTTLFFPEPNALILRRAPADLRVAWYQVRPFAMRWQYTEPGAAMESTDYRPDLKRLVLKSGERGQRLRLLNPESGAATLELSLGSVDSHDWRSHQKHFALVTWHRTANERSPIRDFIEHHLLALLMPHRQRGDATPTTTQFFDVATGTESCRIDHAGANPDMITPDGDALILYQEADADGEAAILCYDIPPARQWRFIVGIPLALAVMLLALRVGWRRVWRNRRANG
jgi:hypothetical protein